MTDEPSPLTLRSARGPVEYATRGEGPAVLALHGAMGGWDQSMLLARTVDLPAYRVIALSRPGYLGTPLASGRTSDEQADLYAATLDALGIERTAIVAISGGGLSAIRFALRHPGRCRALVLISTVGAPMALRLPLSLIPGAELLAIDGGEHVAIFTHRELVRARVNAFLRAHAAG